MSVDFGSRNRIAIAQGRELPDEDRLIVPDPGNAAVGAFYQGSVEWNDVHQHSETQHFPEQFESDPEPGKFDGWVEK